MRQLVLVASISISVFVSYTLHFNLLQTAIFSFCFGALTRYMAEKLEKRKSMSKYI